MEFIWKIIKASEKNEVDYKLHINSIHFQEMKSYISNWYSLNQAIQQEIGNNIKQTAKFVDTKSSSHTQWGRKQRPKAINFHQYQDAVMKRNKKAWR